MTREEAIKEAYGIPVTKAQHEALQILIPELAESEDERIRKWLYEYIERVGKTLGKPGPFDYTQILDYLERHKECSLCNFPKSCGDCPKEIQDAIDKEFGIDGRDDNDNPLNGYGDWKKGMVLNGPAIWGLVKLGIELQKEQKPVEWGDGEKKVLDSIIDDYEKAAKSFCGYDGKIMFLKAIRDGEYNLPNPAEWSEEDEEHIKSLLARLEGMCKKEATFTQTRFAVSEDIDWLKSISERFVLQPKQEWSEDERIRKWLIEMVEELRKANPTNAEYNGNCSEAIAYLEKQKYEYEVFEPVESTLEYKIGFNAGKESIQKAEWREEDDKFIKELCNLLASIAKNNYIGRYYAPDLVSKLQSLRPQPKQELKKAEIEHLHTIASFIKSTGYEDDGEFLEGVANKLSMTRKEIE